MRYSLFYMIILVLSGYGSYCQTQEEESEVVFEIVTEPDEVVVVEGDTIVYTPEKSPAFPGGEASLDEYFRKYLPGYSKTKTRKNDKEVWVSFVIRSSGTIGKTNIIGSEKPEINEKLTKALKSMPAWTPAVSNGKKVATIGDFHFYFE